MSWEEYNVCLNNSLMNLVKVNIVNLIFKEYIGFLKDKGIDVESLGLKEGFYWLDNQIIKTYDKQGELHKIARLFVDDNLNISIKTVYKNKPYEIESWQETVERNIDKLKMLEEESKTLIINSVEKYKDNTLINLSSGGKDSSVVTYLVRSLYPNTQIIFNNTTLDCADTYLHIKSLDNVHIINPKEGFYQWTKRLNFVNTRTSRSCCSVFKEGAMVENLNKDNKYLFSMGMRNEESNTRSGYGDEWKNEKWGNREWQGILPIRKWNEEEVWLYILWKNININSKYRRGYSRVGCAISCPFYTKSTWVLDQYWYPKMYYRWQDILDKDFVNNNKALIMNCTKEEYKLKAWNGGVYRSEPTEDVIKEFATQNELDVNIASRYFNHTCEDCDRRIKSKEVLSMNMKYNGRNTNRFFCKKCLMKRLNMTKEQWNDKVKQFKDQGCSLF